MASRNLKYEIELCFACRELVNLDIMTKTDPFLKVYEKKGTAWNLLGQTEVVYNNLNPEFNKKIKMNFFFEDIQPLKVEVYHHDSDQKFIKIGEVEFNLSSLTGIKDNTLEKEIIDTIDKKPRRGKLLARYDEVSNRCDNVLKLTGHNIKSVVLCGSNKNFLEIHKPRNPLTVPSFVGQKTSDFDFCKKEIPDNEWVLVYRTQNHMKNVLVDWQEFSINKGTLCSSLDDLPLKLAVWHYGKDSGNHKLIGGVILTYKELLRLSTSGQRCEIKSPAGVKTGELSVPKLSEVIKYSFIDYLKGGLNIALIIGIDFTGSNGSTSNSLHMKYPKGSEEMNPYQQAIIKGAEVLLEYDTDKMVPVYGFGARTLLSGDDTSVSHCFPCTGLFGPGEDEVQNIDGIFNVYKQALEKVRLDGPTLFEPLLRKIVNIAREGSSKNPDNYYFFLILTDGEIHDMGPTMKLIVEACDLPLSIVIVGLGIRNFGSMKVLDEGNFDSQGCRNPTRDICRFVEFEKFKNNLGTLRAEMLAEIPGQVEEYFKMKNRPPNMPQSVKNSEFEGPASSAFRPPKSEYPAVLEPSTTGIHLDIAKEKNTNYPPNATEGGNLNTNP